MKELKKNMSRIECSVRDATTKSLSDNEEPSIFSLSLSLSIEQEWDWVQAVRRPITGPMCQPEMMSVEQSLEWVAGETEVLGENQPQCRFVHHKSHITLPELETGSRRLTAWATARP
jgi:hypothetical protein